MALGSKRIRKALCFVLGVLLCMPAFCQWDRDALEFRGRLALQDGKYASAIETFNILATLDTSYHWTFFYRGIAKYNLGDLRGAMNDFDRSVRLNPIFTNGYHYRAIAKSRFGDYDAALNDLEKAIELRPGNSGLYYSRGVTYFLAQRFDEAVEDFNRYLRMERNDPSAYLNRGASYLFLADTTKAMADYNKAIKLDRYEPEGYIRRARLKAEMGDYPEAIKDMDRAIELDRTNTLAFFNRALMHYETKDYNSAMDDLNTVLKSDPGNALTLYNRSLIYMQVGQYEDALDDMDRVININPGNVLAYFNRASVFIELGRWRSALSDYDKAIELYPDFAKAYQNRAYVENQLGMKKKSKADYETAMKKIREYQRSNASGASFADTTRKYSALLSLDADFAKKDFDDELLQHRDIDIRLKPMFRIALADERVGNVAFVNRYENKSVDAFLASTAIPTKVSNINEPEGKKHTLAGYPISRPEIQFLRGIRSIQDRQYNQALANYNAAIENASASDKAFYLVNRAVLKAEMIDFIASIENNVQTLSMDDQGAAKTRLADRVNRTYDYSDALSDMEEAAATLPNIAYIDFNLGNLYCLSSQPVKAIEMYDKALNEFPIMGEGYYNRGLVLIFLKDREKGCIDLSRAGELGIKDAYSVINKYCKQGNE